MDALLIGNIIGLTGSVLMVSIGLIRSKKNILIAQCVMFTILAVSNLILGGVTGAVSNGLSILRNVLCFVMPFGVVPKVIFIALQLILCAVTNNLGIIGMMPAVAGGIFTWVLDTKDGIVLKAAIIVGQLAWCFFDFTIRNYTTLCFDIAAVISNAAGILMLLRARKHPAAMQETGAPAANSESHHPIS